MDRAQLLVPGQPSPAERLMAADSDATRILPPPESVGQREWRGHLELAASLDSAGRSCLSRQSFCAPYHIGKPHWTGGGLALQIVNCTAGLFAGDRLRCAVRVENGARLQLVQPSATRVHSMESGEARLSQQFSVSATGRLSAVSSLLCPHRESRFCQQTRIGVEKAGELFYVESFAPGRAAHEEIFQFRSLDSEFELRYAGGLVVRERFRLTPDSLAVSFMRRHFTHPFWGAAYVVSERLADGVFLERTRQLRRPDVWLGATALAPAVCAIKVIAQESSGYHRVISELQEIVNQTFGFGLELRTAPERFAAGGIGAGSAEKNKENPTK